MEVNIPLTDKVPCVQFLVKFAQLLQPLLVSFETFSLSKPYIRGLTSTPEKVVNKFGQRMQDLGKKDD